MTLQRTGGENLCRTCKKGAPADNQLKVFSCYAKGGIKRNTESRTDYFKRSLVEAKQDCTEYVHRE